MYGLAWDPDVWNAVAKRSLWKEKQSREYYIKEYVNAFCSHVIL